MYKLKSFILNHTALVMALLIASMTLCLSAANYRGGEVNYRCADATWHTLWTIEAYNETPYTEHLFLPLVTLGGDEDRYIPYGATLLGKNGIYYYTSFSPAGFVMPWLFMKLFSLPINEKSLYLFNTLLFTISAAIWTWFAYMVYKDSSDSRKIAAFISMIAGLTYVISPELMHGMGISYWHQSIMQVTLIVQFIAYYQMETHDSKCGKVIFYIMALINPYIEWTGYVANVGFALSELIWNRKRGGGAKPL